MIMEGYEMDKGKVRCIPRTSKHEIKCKHIFEEIKNGAGLYVSVEGNVSESSGLHKNEMIFDDMRHVRISVLTDEIIEYDFEMFSAGDNIVGSRDYRPFFASFVVDMEKVKLEQVQRLGDGWHCARIVQSENEVEEGELVLKGILEISASPVNYLDDKVLVFTNRAMEQSVLDKINSTYDTSCFKCTDAADIEKILEGAWLNDCPKTIDIYNVGHGNADYIRGFHNRILYDIGYNYRSFPKRSKSNYLRAVNALRAIKPSCVILSHWDLDHIIGCAYAEQDVFSVKWIAPHLVSSSDNRATVNSIRLAHYLHALGNLCLVDRDQPNKLIATISGVNDIVIKLWLGSGNSNLTCKNNEGLILEIDDSKKVYPHILLAGDVPYKCMPDILNESYDFMHVPHHCSNMEIDRLKSIPGVGKCAVISTNRKKDGTLNHGSTHYKELKNKFLSVINTIDSMSGIDEDNLSVEISYRTKSVRFR